MLDQNSGKLSISPVARCTGIDVDKVSLTLDGKNLISDFTCSIKGSGKTLVIGPNGAGKSLFLRLLTGLVVPSSGSIEGPYLQKSNQEKANQILVFQKPVMLRRTAFDNIRYVLRQSNYPRSELHDRAINALQAARLEPCAKTPARRLSGGEQQRLAIARALAVDPDMLLLDEPTASLDPASTFVVQEMIQQANDNGTKIIFVTHDIKQAKQLADDIVFIHHGRIMAHQEAQAFFAQPDCKEAQDYLDGRFLF